MNYELSVFIRVIRGQLLIIRVNSWKFVGDSYFSIESGS
jgi:hypothetical protein